MTKRDFEIIARCVAKGIPDIDIRTTVVVNMCRELRLTYPYFDPYRFLKACGLPETTLLAI